MNNVKIRQNKNSVANWLERFDIVENLEGVEQLVRTINEAIEKIVP